MKSALRVVALALTAVIGLWAAGHGIAVAIRTLAGEHADILGELIEVSVLIAGGVCVLSVAVEQLYCWRTHRRQDSLL
jgi:hypothetical protein